MLINSLLIQRRQFVTQFMFGVGVLIFVFLVGNTQAQNTTQSNNNLPMASMATKSVSMYLGLERTLQQSLDEHNQSAVEKMLDTDFELRSSVSEDTITSTVWLKDEFKDEPKGTQISRKIRDLSVFEKDNIAIVSFLLERKDNKLTKRRLHPQFIVDVWQKSTNKLLIRYMDDSAISRSFSDQPNGRE